MTEIKLDPKFAGMVKSGRKVTTIRTGQRAYDLGEAVLVCGEERLPINIKGLVQGYFYDMDDDVALADGFSTVQELFDTMKEFYPDFTNDSIVTMVVFKYMGEE